eukprot:10702800-Lingulodinium_polyedra.AAC.1
MAILGVHVFWELWIAPVSVYLGRGRWCSPGMDIGAVQAWTLVQSRRGHWCSPGMDVGAVQ